MSDDTRTETDTLGDVRVPAAALWGAQTQRAIDNFPVSGRRLPGPMIHALGLVKRAAAEENAARGLLPPPLAAAVIQAAGEVAGGLHDDAFPVDVFQTGSGTSSHMNANEVIANRAIQILGGVVGSKTPVHPNDHVNRGQSSNDVFPSALHVAALAEVERELLPGLRALGTALDAKARELDGVVKLGRTHLMDAVPLRLGQEISGWAAQVAACVRRVEDARGALGALPLGGTAVGTGLGAAPGFATAVVARLAHATGLPLRQAPNLFEALASRDAVVEMSGALRAAAVSLTKIANDVRWLASGPHGGLGELRLPELQPGSSIMPGKVNPVMSEMLLMVCAQVIGNDATAAWGGAAGNLELNAMTPVLALALLSSIELLGRGARLFAERCVAGMTADPARCAALAEHSPALATALAARLGYDAAAAVAREAAATGKTVRAICTERALLPQAELDRLLDLAAMTVPPRA